MTAALLASGCSNNNSTAGTPVAVVTPSPSPGSSSTPTPCPSGATPCPSPSPTVTPSATPSPIPSIIPTVAPTASYAQTNLYVSNANPLPGAIAVFPITSNGTVTPARVLTGNFTLLSDPVGLTFDYAGNLYVANFGSRAAPSAVTAYAPGVNGNVAPALALTGGLTGLAQTVGVAFDPYSRLYALNTGASSIGSIQVFLYQTSGNGQPIGAIQGGSFSGATAIKRGGDGNLNVVNAGAGTMVTIPYNTFGAPTPIRTLTGLTNPAGIALDSQGKIYIVNATSFSIYPAGANGAVAPTLTVTSGITNGVAIAVDASGDVFVANQATATAPDSIVVYPPGATTPSATIVEGGGIGLSTIQGIEVGP